MEQRVQIQGLRIQILGTVCHNEKCNYLRKGLPTAPNFGGIIIKYIDELWLTWIGQEITPFSLVMRSHPYGGNSAVMGM